MFLCVIRKVTPASKHGPCLSHNQKQSQIKMMRLYCVAQPCSCEALPLWACNSPVRWPKAWKAEVNSLCLCHCGPLLWLYKQDLFFMLPWQRLREFEVGKAQSLQIIFDYRHIACSHSRQGFVGIGTPRMYKCLFLWPVSALVGFLLLTFQKTILLKCSP